MKILFFSTCIFNLSPKVFTQISSVSTRWMKILISHPRSTHVAYFGYTPLRENGEIHKKRDCNHVFRVFLSFRVAGSIESMQHGYSLDEELNFSSNEYSHSKFE